MSRGEVGGMILSRLGWPPTDGPRHPCGVSCLRTLLMLSDHQFAASGFRSKSCPIMLALSLSHRNRMPTFAKKQGNVCICRFLVGPIDPKREGRTASKPLDMKTPNLLHTIGYNLGYFDYRETDKENRDHRNVEKHGYFLRYNRLVFSQVRSHQANPKNV
jgi:hypothetical protein